jgi:hypothetical protein
MVTHDVEAHGTGWKCRTCGEVAHNRKEGWHLRRKVCTGPCAMRAASSHALVHLAGSGVTACLRCGAWATRRPRRLLRQCPGVAPTYATKEARKRIRLGLHPIAKVRKYGSIGDAPANLHGAQTGRSSWSKCLGKHAPKQSSGMAEDLATASRGKQHKRDVKTRLSVTHALTATSNLQAATLRCKRGRTRIQGASQGSGTNQCATVESTVRAASGAPGKRRRLNAESVATRRAESTAPRQALELDVCNASKRARVRSPEFLQIIPPKTCCGSLESVKPSVRATCGCGAPTSLECKRCCTPVCLPCAKAKRAHT